MKCRDITVPGKTMRVRPREEGDGIEIREGTPCRGGTKPETVNRVEIHGIEVQFVGVEQQEADHFALADLRIRCGRDEPEGAKVVAPRYCRRPEPVDPGYLRPARPN